MLTPKYVLQKTTSSFCPTRNGLVYLLCPEHPQQAPQFYICFTYKNVKEVGKGPVEEISKR